MVQRCIQGCSGTDEHPLHARIRSVKVSQMLLDAGHITEGEFAELVQVLNFTTHSRLSTLPTHMVYSALRPITSALCVSDVTFQPDR